MQRVDDSDDVDSPCRFPRSSGRLDWSPLRGRLVRQGPRSPFGMIASIAVFSACLSAAFVYRLWSHVSNDPEWRDGVFRLERSLNLAGGVSSVFAMFFLVLAGAALVFSRLRDLYLFDQCMPHYPMPRREVDEHDVIQMKDRRLPAAAQ